MGDVVRFRPRRTPVRPHGIAPARFGRPRRRGGTWREAWRAVRWWALAIFVTTATALWQGAGFFEPPAVLMGQPQWVSGTFTRCGYGRGALCVVDGDTFKLGDRKIRVNGIDTAELEARCPAEALQAEASTRAAQDWLNRGPFTIAQRIDAPTDRYGRDLAVIKRPLPGGGADDLAAHMIAHGGARGYDGQFRAGWC